MIPAAHPGWPAPEWEVAAQSNGTVGLRIIERRIETGMIDMTPEQARELAVALNLCAATVQPYSTPVDNGVTDGK